jgi:hypothetical protein
LAQPYYDCKAGLFRSDQRTSAHQTRPALQGGVNTPEDEGYPALATDGGLRVGIETAFAPTQVGQAKHRTRGEGSCGAYGIRAAARGSIPL